MPELYDNESRAGEKAPKSKPSRPAPGTSPSAPLGPPMPSAPSSLPHYIAAPAPSAAEPASVSAAPKLATWSPTTDLSTGGLNEQDKPKQTLRSFSQDQKQVRLDGGEAPPVEKDREKREIPPEIAARMKKLTPMPMREVDTMKMGNIGGVVNGVYYPPTMVPMTAAEIQELEENRPEPVQRKARELTWERYNNLSDTQRAAVDFNSMLVRAREKDLNTDYKPSEEEEKKYDMAVEEIFGSTAHGGPVFAPETVAVLQQVKWEANDEEGLQEGDRLDDFLNLDVAITGKQLRGLDIKVVDEGTSTASGLAGVLDIQHTLVENTSEMQKQMAEQGHVMQNFQAAAARLREDLTKYMGGTENKYKVGLGWGPTDSKEDAEFQAIFEVYADSEYEQKFGQTMEQGLGLLREGLAEDGKLEDFMVYVDRRTQQAGEYGLPLGSQMRVKYRTPEEFRAVLGLSEES